MIPITEICRAATHLTRPTEKTSLDQIELPGWLMEASSGLQLVDQQNLPVKMQGSHGHKKTEIFYNLA